MAEAVSSALHGGNDRRAEHLAQDLVARYPGDPRAYDLLAEVLTLDGRWADAETVCRQELSLDSLAATAVEGACIPCEAYNGLVSLRAAEGDLVGAEALARRWTALQPDLPAAWSNLAFVLGAEQRYDAALAAAGRAAALAPADPEYPVRVGRLLLAARRYEATDSLIATLRAGGANAGAPDDNAANALDLLQLRQRERGELRAAARTVEALTARYPGSAGLRLTLGDDLARLGRYRAARRVFEAYAHAGPDVDVRAVLALPGDDARAFCWAHALEAEAIAGDGDTTLLRVLADSIEQMAARSYYARDRQLAHHVRGLIALRTHRYAEAVAELQAARWGPSGWTATNLELARAYLGMGRPLQAIAVLRDAYRAPLDAMGRYVPHSELDLLMAIAFRQAQQRDSSAVYTAYVRRAWQRSDPEVRARLRAIAP